MMDNIKIIFGAFAGLMGAAAIFYSSRLHGYSRTHIAVHEYGTLIIALILIGS